MVQKGTLEFVVPVYNESDCIDEFVRRILALRLRASDLNVKVCFVNDGSSDDSLEKLLDHARRHPFFRIINLSRNFGHQIAVTAGLDAVDADYVCIIDADLQDPPEIALDMFREMRQTGANIIYAQRRRRAGESAFKRLTAALFYRVLRALCTVDIPRDTGDFRLIDRKVVTALQGIREHRRFLRGLVPWMGFKSTPFIYDRDPRFAGETKYPLKKMIRLALDAVLTFSNHPLRAATFVGLSVVAAGFVFLIYIVFLKLFTTQVVPGLTVMLVAIIMLGGLQILMLGLVGEYIGRIFEEVRNRPLYFVDSVFSLADEPRVVEFGEKSGLAQPDLDERRINVGKT